MTSDRRTIIGTNDNIQKIYRPMHAVLCSCYRSLLLLLKEEIHENKIFGLIVRIYFSILLIFYLKHKYKQLVSLYTFTRNMGL